MEESPEPMPIRGKNSSNAVLPSCPICGATMDLKRLKPFASRHISDDGRLFYCNNPMCPPDEWEQKQRLLLDRFGIDAM
ncbi:MAG TPA: hypothetical protein VFQ47_07145 [Nitrososphaera sp.]|jgi:hypothetical protein|nr:hypothetical protein [Nitrososphaera sp.]